METENRKNLIFTGNYKTIINDIIKFYEDKENKEHRRKLWRVKKENTTH